VAIERRGDQKLVTRWGTWSRGGMVVEARDALYFVRQPWSQCQLR
jgi:alpha-amylase